MEFGLFLEFPRPIDGDHHDAFVQSFRLVQEAEDLGVKSVWLAEYHFNMERVLASPVTIASAIAAKTSTMRIGTAVYCLPLGHPIRVAEEMAVLDHISDGRLEMGIGRGTFPNVHEGFNVSFEESRSRFDEFLEVVVAAWTQETFSFHGEHFSCEELTVTPRPYQQPHPPITIGVTSAESFPIVGAMGYPLIVNPSRVFTLDELAEHTAAYRKAWKNAGHAGEGKVGLRVPVYVNEDVERAYLDPKESAVNSITRLGNRVGSYAGRAGTLGDWAEQSRRILGMDYDDWLRDKVVYGTPDQVTDRLAELEDTLGLDQCIYEINYGNLMSDELQTASLRLFNKKVLPELLTE